MVIKKKSRQIIWGLVVEIPYRKVSSVLPGVMGNSELAMKNILKCGSESGAVGRIEKTENENFNLLFIINARPGEYILYAYTGCHGEAGGTLSKGEGVSPCDIRWGQIVYVYKQECKYMVFDEEKNIKSMSDVEAYLYKYLRMLQETMDAASLL